MATKSSSNDEPTPDQQDEEPPTEVPTPTEPPEPTPTSEGSHYSLPPAMVNAGGVGVVGVVSGLYTVADGSYLLTPGTPMMMSAAGAQALIEQGVAVSLDDYQPIG